MRHRTVRELMTSPAVCARPEWTVAEAVRVMQEHRVKRLPVVGEAERLVGIVSRSDLLRVFPRRDHAIRAEIVKDVVAETLGEAPSAVGVSVEGGRAVLTGMSRAGASYPCWSGCAGASTGSSRWTSGWAGTRTTRDGSARYARSRPSPH